MTRLIFMIAAFLLAAPAQAVTYRWIDDNGIVNFSERKPRGIDESRLTTIDDRGRGAEAAAAAAPVTPAPQQSTLPAMSERQEQMLAELEVKEQERQAQVAKIRADNCERAHRVLDNLSARSRIRVRGDDGEQRVLPEEERQERISQAQRGIVENC